MNGLPPCVLPRRRFVRIAVVLCLLAVLGLLMPCSAVAILLFCGMEEMGMCFPRWMHMVMTPLALIFWVGGVLYPFVWALLALWRGLVAQKMQK